MTGGANQPADGPSFNQRADAIDWIESRFRKGRPATLYFDEVRSCTYTDDLNRVFEYFLSTELRGLFHVAGPRAMTLYQIGQTSIADHRQVRLEPLGKGFTSSGR